jgi:Zn-dependent metalloprotease
MPSGPQRAAAKLFCLALLATTPAWTVGPAQPARALDVDQAIASMRTAGGSELEVERSAVTGLVRFMSGAKSRGIPLIGAGSPDVRALKFVDLYGRAFGLDRDSVVVERVSKSDDTGMDHVRLQQVVKGIPVAGGEAIVHLRDNRVISVLARTVPDLGRVTTTPAVGAAAASSATRALLAKHLSINNAELSAPRLEIFNKSLFDGGPLRPSRLTWFVEANTFDRREYVWIDAATGDPLLHFNQMPHSRIREVYDAESGSSLSGTLVRSEGDGDTSDTDTDLAYLYSGDTYDYYWTEHDRDSYDDAGSTLVSTVHFCPSPGECPYGNAFWNGNQMVYGEGFAAADDVVAHELTHAVTERTAGLYYYMQSGALNESFSDIFGETVDLTNAHGYDDPSVRWLMGEELSIGAIRDMWDPNVYGQPEKMSDPTYFYCGSGDYGGVHYNSGLPNLAYALMVDGGSLNGFTITGIGLTKAGKIQYKVLTEYLVSGSDFADNYDAVNQACSDLVGTAGIITADCTEVDKAMQAVELAEPWACLPAQSDEPDLCGAGEQAVDLFFDDVDTSGGDGWGVFTSDGDDPNCLWYLDSFATSGSLSYWAPDDYVTCTTDIRMMSNITIPVTGATLRFNHAFAFETYLSQPYDGGFILFSTNSGTDWQVADCSSCDGFAYNGTLAEGTLNTMAGETGFAGDSYGYTASQLDLSPLAGQDVRFGFRVSTDESVGDYGWWLDDIRIFECVATGGDSIFSDGFETSDMTEWSSTVGGP